MRQLIQLKRNLTKQMTVKKQPMRELKESLPLPDKRKVEVKDVIKSAARKRSNKLLKSGKVLNPEMLDMIAAKDNRLNSKRSKGRLCNRHVLIPEGPKYDSAGRVYLPAHADSQPFERTPRPRLLLPICCNCCKKSVLGCQ
ncbi:unnamed protein product [Parnassius apollo]|uniref:(apollo) hypothetical protein n=1 Tax=Parnassius apollo TaxID=110799 RepID=A0A8S3XIF0_PARAO|nr:unnamed protein product [Parnassius apollo]